MMETIRTKKMIPKYVEVQSDDFEMVEVYKTSDGETFTELRDATKHESEFKFSKVEKTSYWFPMVSDIWYKAKDKDELEFLIEHLSENYGGRRYGESRLKVGEWFTHVTRDRDGQGPADHFLPLSKLKQDFSELLKLLEE
jgi:hypothetical protein